MKSEVIQIFTDLKQSTGDYYAQYGPLAGTAGNMAPDVLLTLLAPYASRLTAAGLVTTADLTLDLVSTLRTVASWDNSTLGAVPGYVANAGTAAARAGGATEAAVSEAGGLASGSLSTEGAALSSAGGAPQVRLGTEVSGAGAETSTAVQVLDNVGDVAAGSVGTSALGGEVDAIARNGGRLVIDQRYVSEVGDVACGPTCCAMVMNDRGQWVNISNIAQDAALVPGIGTDVNGLANALQTNGVGTARAVFGVTVDDLAKATANGESAIVHVSLNGDIGHFVVVDGVTIRGGQTVVAIRDPLDGQFFVPVDQFQAKFSGQAVLTNGPH